MLIRWLSAAGVCLFAAFIGGCAFAPGQHMDTGALQDNRTDLGVRVNLVSITPELIAKQADQTQHQPIPETLLSYTPPNYRIGSGDVLHITVWNHPELTIPAGSQQPVEANGRLVLPDGTLYYPYIGTIKVSGMTIKALRAYIAEKLSAYVKNPQVGINVIKYGSKRVWLNGAFLNPGAQPITITPLTLAQAIAKAQPNLKRADLSNLVLERDGVIYHLDIHSMHHGARGAWDIYLKAGDHIFLSYNDKHQIYVLGEVNKPRALTFRTATMSLMQALGKAGGLDQVTSNGEAVYVIRGVANMERQPATIFQLDASSPASFILAANFELKPGDVVFVGAAGITRWNRFLSQLLPFSNIVSDTAALQN